MKIFVSSDHAGFIKKNELIEKLEKSKKHNEIYDMGPYLLDPNDDYPLYASKVAMAVSENHGSLGILVCKSGEGMAIAANKIKGIRAVSANNESLAKLSRRDNDSNILSLSAKELSDKEVFDIVSIWLSTPFSGLARHKRRIEEISQLEEGKML